MTEISIQLSRGQEAGLRAGGEEYVKRIRENHSRELSWEHCFRFFSLHREGGSEDTLDHLSLHLAFYLASWGMYRGSSDLLQKDYLIHRPAVELLLEERWQNLWYLPAEELADPATAQQVAKLGGELEGSYAAQGVHATQTLVTKILLGTLGCSPAYDENFQRAARALGRGLAQFGAPSLSALARLYQDDSRIFDPLQKQLSMSGLSYPPMKILDMCFFQYGQGLGSGQ